MSLTQRQLLLLHIPKTAGTTLIQILECSFRASECYRLTTEAEALHDPRARLAILEKYAKFRFLSGHIPYGSTGGLRKSFTVVTALRHPIDRVLSLHGFYCDPRRRPESLAEERKISAARAGKPATFAECRHPLVRNDVSNGMCRQLVDAEPHEVDALDDDMLFSLARTTLQKCPFGLSEDLERSLCLLQHTLEIWTPRSIPTVNRTRRRMLIAELSPVDYERIARANLADLLLFQWAEGEFARRLEAMADAEVVKQSASRCIPNLRPIRDGRTWTWDCSGVLHGENWHQVEKDSKGRYYRFTGPATRSSLWFRIPREITPVRISIHILFAVEAAITETIRVELGGVAVVCQHRYIDELGLFLDADIPPESLRERGLFKISLVTGYTVQPSALDAKSEDDRALGVAMAGISIEATV